MTTPTDTAIQSLVTSVKSATNIDWTSPSFIEGVITKGLAVVAIYHPSLNVGQWEPVIVGVSLGIVAAESTIRGLFQRKQVSAVLSAAQKVVATAANFDPTPPPPPAPSPDLEAVKSSISSLSTQVASILPQVHQIVYDAVVSIPTRPVAPTPPPTPTTPPPTPAPLDPNAS